MATTVTKSFLRQFAQLIGVREYQAEDADELVTLAFYEDTKQFNNMEQCKLVHPDDPWLRAVVTEGADQ